MTTGRMWTLCAVLTGWILFWAAAGHEAGTAVVLHWPILLVLLFGYRYHLKGGLAAAAGATLLVPIVLQASGSTAGWTVIGWQALMYALFGLYPFKFIQVREQRHHHYRTLIEYKRGEMEQLRSRLADVDRHVREAEARAKGGAP